MKTVIKGKNIHNVYSVKSHIKKIVDAKGNKVKVYTAKPELCVEKKIDSWADICSFEGVMQYDSHYFPYNSFWNAYEHRVHISEDESVRVDSISFRADLNEHHAFTDKVISETNINKTEAETEYQTHLHAFNKMMIESNEKMLSYCTIHNLNIENTDALQLFELVYPKGYYYHIENGKMVAGKYLTVDTSAVTCSTSSSSYNTVSKLSNLSNIQSYADATTVTTALKW